MNLSLEALRIPPAVAGRVRRGARFLAIVWTVAGAFQILTTGVPALFHRLVVHGVVDETTIPNVPSQCKPAERAADAQPRDLAVGRALSWQLGLGLGMATGVRNLGLGDANQLARLREQNVPIAAALGVRTPEVPVLVSPTNALYEYTVHLEADPQCVVHDLARLYSTTHGALFHFAATVGHVVITRSYDPETGALFVPELRRYGGRAQIPEAAWRALIEDFDGQPRPHVQARLCSAIETIERRLSPPASPGARFETP